MQIFLCLIILFLSAETVIRADSTRLRDVIADTYDLLHDINEGYDESDSKCCRDMSVKCQEQVTRNALQRKCRKTRFKRQCQKSCNQCANLQPCTSPPTPTSAASPQTEKSATTPGSGGTVKSTPDGSVSSSIPVKCNEMNRGHCECGDVNNGFQTYTFEVNGQKRCFTVYNHIKGEGKKMPVVITSQCYGKDKLVSIDMVKPKSVANTVAIRYGFVRIGISTPDGGWTFGNDNVVNDTNPMPCSDADSKDIPYVKAVMKFIESHPDDFDTKRVYTDGFSQNSGFSQYIGFCFSDNVAGIWTGGGGMALNGEPPNLPGCQGQCTRTMFKKSSSCDDCIAKHFCTECQYWPIYPCYNQKRPMINCLASYTNDYIGTYRRDTSKVTAVNMFVRLEHEGHDGRLLRFSPSIDGTIPGSHKNPKNDWFWKIGCLGITDHCNSECERSFSKCVMNENSGTASERVNAFESCIKESKFEKLDGCVKNCAPTLAMMSESERPTTIKFSKKNDFGPGGDEITGRPKESKCEVKTSGVSIF